MFLIPLPLNAEMKNKFLFMGYLKSCTKPNSRVDMNPKGLLYNRLSTFNRRAFVIPLVVFGVGMAGVFVMIYSMTVKSQRRFDLLAEQDMRSYYIAQAGFQFYLGKYKNTNRYEERWYKPHTSWSEKKDFGYEEEGGKGFFELFIEEISTDQGFSHLFMIVRGVYIPQVGKPDKNITMLRGNLRFTPKPPSDEPQTVILESPQPLSKSQLLQYIKDPRYADFFKEKNRQFSPEITRLLEFLKTGDISDIDFSSQTELLKALARIESLNEQLAQRLRLLPAARKPALALKLDDFRQKILSGAFPHLSPEQAAEKLNFTMMEPGFFNEISAGNGNLAQQMDKLILNMNMEKKQKLAIEYVINQLAKLNPRTMISLQPPQSPDLKTIIPVPDTEPQKMPLGHFVTILYNMAHSGEFSDQADLIKRLKNQHVRLELPHNSIRIETVLNANPNPLEELLNQEGDESSDTENGENANDQTEENPSEHEPEANNDPNNNEEETEHDTGDDEEEESTAENFLDDDKLLPEVIFPELYGEDFENISLETPTSNNTPGGKGLKQEYLDYLNQNMKTWYFRDFVLNRKTPTRADFDDFKRQHPIPDFKIIDQVGNILDNLVKSDDYEFRHIMPVRNIVDRNNPKATLATPEIPREVFKVEIFKKLRYRTPPPRNNQELIDMFRISAIADAQTSGMYGKARDENGNILESRMYLVDRKSGQKIYMDDYIRSQLEKK
jgi:hypothetical protein